MPTDEERPLFADLRPASPHTRNQSDAYEKQMGEVPRPRMITDLPDDITGSSPLETAAYWYEKAQHHMGKEEHWVTETIRLKAELADAQKRESALTAGLMEERQKTAEFVTMLREISPGAFVAGTSEIDAARHVVKTVRDALVAFAPIASNVWVALMGNLRAAGLDVDKIMKGRS